MKYATERRFQVSTVSLKHHIGLRPSVTYPSDTRSCAGAKSQIVLLHSSQLLRRSLLRIPALRHKFCGIFAKDLLVPVRYPWIDADDGLVAVSTAFCADTEHLLLTPGGRCVPSISSPAPFISRHIGKPTTGCTRSDSLITIWR